MNAILYVAGRALRMGKVAQEKPKILLEIGGVTLLERHVRILSALKVPQLYVVTGFGREQLQAEFPRLEHDYGVRIVEMFNPDYTEGSVISMYCSLPALEQSRGSILLMDGDVLYDVPMLDRLMRSEHPSALLIDRNYSTADDDPVLVPMRGGKPFEFAKKWQGEADAIGESIGFFKLDGRDIPTLVQETTKRAVGSERRSSYDEVLRALVRDGRFGAEDITGMPWTEIDFPEDIVYANDVILPALK